MFFVAGITGQVGGAAARQLLAAGKSVRALVRDPKKAAVWAEQGVEILHGDFTDTASVASALEGVEGAFLMMPPLLIPSPGFPEAKEVIASFTQALRQSPPPRLVLLSSVGSEKSSGLGNITTTHLMEEALGGMPFPTAVVRAGGFIENYIGSMGIAAKTGFFDSFMGPVDRAFPGIATADIGAETARLLISGWEGQKIVELGSPISPNDLARAMSEVLGQPVEARTIPREQWATVLQQMGFPRSGTDYWEEMMDGFNSGWIDFGVPGAESVAGTTTAAQVFKAAQEL